MSPTLPARTIGGYFPLERGTSEGSHWLELAIGYQSARSALAAVIAARRPRIVWVPNFVCGVVNDTLRSTGVETRRYALTELWGVPQEVTLGSDDCLLCVDYYGINGTSINRAIDRYGVDRVLVDAAQSLFHLHRPGGTTIYSPRKFLGVPDGGLVRTTLALRSSSEADESESVARCQHLLYRLAGSVEKGFKKFQEAEATLSGCAPVGMSGLTRALLCTIDLQSIARRRIENYQCLAEALRRLDLETVPLAVDEVPLCCPVRVDEAAALRLALAARAIFTPTYWPEAVIPESDSVASTLRDRTLNLPCDQRYTSDDMQYMVDVLQESITA